MTLKEKIENEIIDHLPMGDVDERTKAFILERAEGLVRDIAMEYLRYQADHYVFIIDKSECFDYFLKSEYPERPQRAFIGTSVDPEDLRL